MRARLAPYGAVSGRWGGRGSRLGGGCSYCDCVPVLVDWGGVCVYIRGVVDGFITQGPLKRQVKTASELPKA